MNRLKLNWKLDTKEERNAWLTDYLSSLNFTPTPEELSTMTNYILWGKSSATGLNGRQEGLDIETVRATWDNPHKTSSLDEIIERPGFSEASFRGPNDPVYHIPRTVFSRSEARSKAPPAILSVLESLWTQIDETELTLNFYEIDHNKRTNAPRDQLVQAVDPSRIEALRARASNLPQAKYLLLKHELVELRRQQYAYVDHYSPQLISRQEPVFLDASIPEIDALPLSLKYEAPIYAKLFRQDRFPEPQDFDEKELQQISQILWSDRSINSKYVIDFTRADQLAILNDQYEDLREILTEDSNFENLRQILDTYDIYCGLSDLKPFQQDILYLKRKHWTHDKITSFIEDKYGHRYSLNYISTLYHKDILESIAEVARLHRQTVENLFFPENFKTCSDCGRTLLRDLSMFPKKKRNIDGLDCRCKQCAKIRNRRKRLGQE